MEIQVIVFLVSCVANAYSLDWYQCLSLKSTDDCFNVGGYNDFSKVHCSTLKFVGLSLEGFVSLQLSAKFHMANQTLTKLSDPNAKRSVLEYNGLITDDKEMDGRSCVRSNQEKLKSACEQMDKTSSTQDFYSVYCANGHSNSSSALVPFAVLLILVSLYQTKQSL